MSSDNDSRYDAKTKTKSSWNPLVQFVNGTQKETTIRDNKTGKEQKGSGKTAEQSRDNAWKKVRQEE